LIKEKTGTAIDCHKECISGILTQKRRMGSERKSDYHLQYSTGNQNEGMETKKKPSQIQRVGNYGH
jgi:hypothetical protein